MHPQIDYAAAKLHNFKCTAACEYDVVLLSVCKPFICEFLNVVLQPIWICGLSTVC